MHRTQIRRRLAAVAAVALAAVAGLAAASTPAGATITRHGPVLALPRTSVPWNKVGPGWALGVDSTQGFETDQPGTDSLLLISPTASRYRIATWADGNGPELLEAWSGDGKRALLLGTPKGTNIATEITLATGAVRSVRLPADTQSVTYSRPSGANFLVSRMHSGLQRFSRAGTLLATLDPTGGNPIYSPGGQFLAIARSTGIALVSNSGKGLRTLPVADGSCIPERWWDADDVLAQCDAFESKVTRLWIVPLSGRTPYLLTPVLTETPSIDYYGDVDAWQLPTGLFVQSSEQCALTLTRRGPGAGSTTEVTPGLGMHVGVLDRVGSNLLVVTPASCGPGGTLALLNPANGRMRTLLASAPGTFGFAGGRPLPFPTSSTPGI